MDVVETVQIRQRVENLFQCLFELLYVRTKRRQLLFKIRVCQWHEKPRWIGREISLHDWHEHCRWKGALYPYFPRESLAKLRVISSDNCGRIWSVHLTCVLLASMHH